ncbi:gelsolin, cytoplasmic-like [Zootermopsis nevadensis]|uniref:gelsolin, cytoplasmic-like n=1 Tax=Zootermopsis nevadensis TaxID=136037 RepID=UPI000B8E59A6|nr:gelsolin, cytoplasmic-like [Zootermopsis nevadensis]XP_021929081.1 gelsolin, cytoplasmic-like [Zootermopsis nevadensis]
MATIKQLNVLIALLSLFSCFLHINAAVSQPAVVQDPAFVGAGSKSGVLVWRIEKFNPVAVSSDKYGQFHIGDSYVVLKTKNNRRSWDIHSWHGNETSNDESATAAIKMVELDNLLGGGPVQHREDQGEESDLFRSYFSSGILYLPGGIPSGLRPVNRPR